MEVLDPGVVGVDEVGDVDLDVGGGRVAVEGVNKVGVVVALPQLNLLVRARETNLAVLVLRMYIILNLWQHGYRLTVRARSQMKSATF